MSRAVIARAIFGCCVLVFSIKGHHTAKKKFNTRTATSHEGAVVTMDGKDDSDCKTACHSRQLWSTEMEHLQQTASTRAEVGHCLCCIRPVLITDIGTRKMTFCRRFVDMLEKCSVDTSSLLYNEQCRLLRQGHADKYLLVCFICLPSWKKAVSQHETSRKVETPSLFMHRSNAFLLDSSARTDKLSLLKYMLCATSQVVVGEHGDKVYHPMRTPDFVLLEAVIFFFRSLFARHRCNVRTFSQMFCHFQIVSIVRWHVTGFPLVMTQNRQTQDLRKALRGKIGKLYHDTWAFEGDFMSMQKSIVLGSGGSCRECAACVHRSHVSAENIDDGIVTRATPPLPTSKKMKSYDTFFLKDWNYIYKQIQHTTASESKHTAVLPGHAITCRSHLQQSVISYVFYHTISHRFPKKFRQRNIKRYYSRLMQELHPGVQETPVTVA